MRARISGSGRVVGALATAMVLSAVGVAVGPATAEPMPTTRPARTAEPAHEGIGAAQVQGLTARATQRPSGEVDGLFGEHGDHGPCDQAPFVDKRGDGTIDIVKVSVISNCIQWRWVVRLDRSIDFLNSNVMLIEFDMDDDLENGCGGTDVLAAVYGVPGSFPRNELYRTRTCDDSTWTLLNPAVRVGLVGSTVVFDMPHEHVPSTAFRWYVTVLPGGKDEGRDHAPNGVWRQATFPPRTNKVRVTDIGNETAIVRWSTPPDVAGLRLQTYQVQYKPAGRGPWTTRVVKASRPPQLTLTELEGGTSYTVRVSSRNAQGRSQWSNTAMFQAKGPPSAVRNMRSSFSVALGEYGVWWNEPASFGGAKRVTYRVTYAKDGGPETVVSESAHRSYATFGVEPGTYLVSVQPISTVAPGPVSTFELVIPPPDPPTG